ncbi:MULTISPECIES: zinc ABC transporter substrate-binding protein [unclassified Pseudodesulfovibrio]|uniref:metal ABC transporter solute-binding protein, Zn/Mn family n=1 Tax=unclassified Pseudodesulfovibrio TaxID=2661612 RepID=UPI000FEBFDF1|nr:MULTISPECIES: zinc ABC transporter substrate-binding protein [unclassified Pseudodesulfovibrio]MCJ2163361.1 zinc ABC transporter substrate-binding protein [Pseudodesulfovibrio sp. S3-i]RWU06600.1 ABC transporter substrate-binding protein [Pseudodesulfovibrio sp. S3]
MINRFLLGLLFACLLAGAGHAAGKPRIGITLHPYYSFVSSIVGDTAEVVPLIGEGFNPHSYRPQPEDIKKCMTLDALVVNGIGHDEFAFEIVEAAGMQDKLPFVFANKDVSLIPVSGRLDGKKVVNPHTFVSVTASVRQIYTIAKELGVLFPKHAEIYRKNARAYAGKLRGMKAEYMERIADLPLMDFRCATIHGGYDYLFQDFGLQVTAVIEPGHGLRPTASQLANVIDEIKNLGVEVIFTEMAFPDKYVDTIHEETGIRIRHLSHLTNGEYSTDGFEKGLRANLDALTSALVDVRPGEQGR